MVFVDITSVGWTPQDWVDACTKSGFRTEVRNPKRVRLVTHYGIEQEDIQQFIDALSTIL
jgi:threonine aldolase